MKLLSNKILMVLLVLISVYGYISSCTHEDIVPPQQANPTPVITRGDQVLLPGTMTAGDSTQWKLDKVHSSVLWTTAYVGAAGLLTGRFNQFGMHEVTEAEMLQYTISGQPLKDTSWAFYENDPSKTYINGYVQINTSNTGEPGRDAGCNVSGMSTVAIISGVQNLQPVNLAKIKSTKVEFDPYSNDYIVTLNLTWHSHNDTLSNNSPDYTYDPNLPASKLITKEIVGRLKYIPKARVIPVTGTPYSVFGLQLTFQFNCRDFNISSTSIGDVIDIECNMNFNNK
ncbi:MAG TPA: hypothetical protein PLA68_01875 [Panacibacter sp.]|nr:hypothetical protein [Panacibacter sp.]